MRYFLIADLSAAASASEMNQALSNRSNKTAKVCFILLPTVVPSHADLALVYRYPLRRLLQARTFQLKQWEWCSNDKFE